MQATLHDAPPYEVGGDIVVDGEYTLQFDLAKAIAAYLERNFAKDCTRRCKDKWFDVRCFWTNLKLKGWTDKHCIDIAFEPGIQYHGRYASTKDPCINPDVIAFPLSHFRDKYKEYCAQNGLDFHVPDHILRTIGMTIRSSKEDFGKVVIVRRRRPSDMISNGVYTLAYRISIA